MPESVFLHPVCCNITLCYWVVTDMTVYLCKKKTTDVSGGTVCLHHLQGARDSSQLGQICTRLRGVTTQRTTVFVVYRCDNRKSHHLNLVSTLSQCCVSDVSVDLRCCGWVSDVRISRPVVKLCAPYCCGLTYEFRLQS
jgi:hypothetical protein